MKTLKKKNKRPASGEAATEAAKKRLKTKSREEDVEERNKSKQISESSDEIEDSSSSEDSISSDSSASEEVEHKQKRRKGRVKSSSGESDSSDTEGSSDDEDALTRRSFEGQSDITTGKKTEPKLLYRSNLNSAARELNRLTFNEEHLELLRISPFWLVIDAILRVNTKKKLSMCKKKDQDVKKIIKSYSSKRGCFMIGGEKLKLRNQDFRLTFGICDGSREIEDHLKMGHPEWVKRCFEAEIEAKGKKRFSMDRSVIYRKLAAKVQSTERTDVQDAVRLANCYVLAALLITNQNGSMKNEVAALFEQLEESVLYNWSSYMVGLLLRHIKATGGNTKTIGGCAMILPYFICEHSKIIKPTNPLEFPHFMKWDLHKFHKKFSKVEVRKIKGVKGKVTATAAEMDVLGTQFREQLVQVNKLMEEHEATMGNKHEAEEDQCDEVGTDLNETQQEDEILVDGPQNLE